MPFTFVRRCGFALAAGGVLTFLVNVALTPLLPRGAPSAAAASSNVFLVRQSFSALAGLFLLFGALGIHLRQAARPGRFGAAAFSLAFIGSAFLVAHEWGEVFIVRHLALRAPDALRALEAPRGPGLYDIGAMIALGTFTAGWIALAAAALRATPSARRGAVLVMAGFFAIPLLGAVLPGVWGAVAGNGVLGAGWFLLGADLIRLRPGDGTGTRGA